MWLWDRLGTAGVVLVIATRGVDFEPPSSRRSADVLARAPLGRLHGRPQAGAPGSEPAPGHRDHHDRRHTRICFWLGRRRSAAGLGHGRQKTWLAVAYASVLSLVVAYLLWNRSVKAIGGARTAIYMCVTPVVAVFGAWLIAR